jgi:hypothetical protein
MFEIARTSCKPRQQRCLRLRASNDEHSLFEHPDPLHNLSRMLRLPGWHGAPKKRIHGIDGTGLEPRPL